MSENLWKQGQRVCWTIQFDNPKIPQRTCHGTIDCDQVPDSEYVGVRFDDAPNVVERVQAKLLVEVEPCKPD